MKQVRTIDILKFVFFGGTLYYKAVLAAQRVFTNDHSVYDNLRKVDANRNIMLQSFVSKLSERHSANDTLVLPLWEIREKREKVCFLFVHAAARDAICVSNWKVSTRWSKTSSSDSRPSISIYSSTGWFKLNDGNLLPGQSTRRFSSQTVNFCTSSMSPYEDLRPLVMQVFFRFKNGPFSQTKKKHDLMRLKTEQFHHIFFWTLIWHDDLDHSDL